MEIISQQDLSRNEESSGNKNSTHEKPINWKGIKEYLKELLSLRDDADAEATIESITKSVEFKGVNVWVLFFAIIVASLGLNVNSTAVIIGAMLISPLMGPINGIGLSIGISDDVLLRKSLYNYVVMVVISFVASSLYFLVSPLGDAQSELLARTSPTIFDVLIAFFGGLAGIVALSRKSQPITVISGVAIATALMPPLCTAGYGLATLQLKYMIGAFYLFFINSVFIAFATFVMVRYLNFPHKKYLDPVRAKKVRRSILVFVVLVMIPSVFTAVNVVRETNFNRHVAGYVNAIQNDGVFQNVQLLKVDKSWTPKTSVLTMSVFGKELSDKDIEVMTRRLSEFDIEETKLKVKQIGTTTFDMESGTEMLSELLDKKDDEIAELKAQIARINIEEENMKKYGSQSVQLAREVKVLYPEVQAFSVSRNIVAQTASMKADTICIAFVKWEETPAAHQIIQLQDWLKQRMNEKKVKIVNE